MDDSILRKLRDIQDIKEFIATIEPYYPDLNIHDYTIKEIESALYNTIIKLIGKVMNESPKNMKSFLRDYLLKFEIMNIKIIILNSILGLNKKEKVKQVNFLAEEYLDNMDFIQDLIEKQSLEEIQFYFQEKGSKYMKAVREGINYFQNHNEIFVLEAFLDKQYYENLVKGKKMYIRKEKRMLNLFIDCLVEIYNINMIYRGIRNNLDKNQIKQFTLNNYLFLNEELIDFLIKQKDVEAFLEELENFLKNEEVLGNIYQFVDFKKEHLYWSVKGLYLHYYFEKFKIKKDDIEYLTIYRIIEIIIMKEKEITFDIVPNLVRIIHHKFNAL